MSVQSLSRSALGIIAGSLAPNSAVEVKSDGETVTGVRAVITRTSDGDVMGELGFDTDSVRVPATLAAPKKGSVILVDGVKMTVSVVRTDPAGAMHVIEYSIEQIKED